MLPKLNLIIVTAVILFIAGCQTEITRTPELMVHKEVNDGWTFRQAGEGEWLPAEVPGTVHTDLMENDIIEDPFYLLNEHDVQ